MKITSLIDLGTQCENISKESIGNILERFIDVNQSRLKRIQNFLQAEQRIFLDILALLFHQNNPFLPGFISTETVAGIANYTPTEKTIHIAKSIAENFKYQYPGSSYHPILGIYLMGSVSSVAFTKDSDIDIWLCYDHHLLPAEIDGLQSKATSIEQWAETLDLEVHFYLVDNHAYLESRPAKSATDSNSETQYYLLLEEFYRTALYIAGQTPVWWLVPPEQEQNYKSYVQHLKLNQLITDDETIDFGGLENIPAEEFVTATLWQLYKSLSAPYKSILKLLLMECYASEFPEPQWVCQQGKLAIYQGTYDLGHLDPYVLIYHKIEHYLSHINDPERLQFARQCFYIKIMGGMEKQIDQKKLVDRKTIIGQIAKRYNWPEKMLASFIRDGSWDIKKASQQNDIIMRQLKLCYQRISLFANKNVSLNINQDIQPIGRKLKFFLQKRPGKIDIITTRQNITNKENSLTIFESSRNSLRSSWDLYLGAIPKQNPANIKPFKQGAHSMVELLSWLVSNGLYHENLNLNIYAHQHSTALDNINYALKSLKLFLFKYNLGNLAELDAFKKPSRVIAHLLLLNLDKTGQDYIDKDQLVFKDYVDILSYGANKESFVHSIDQISISNWGEVTSKRYKNLDGLFDCFITCFNQHSQSLPTKIECYTPIYGSSIASGVKNLFIKLSDLLAKQRGQGSPRLIISGESAYYIFQQKDSFLHYRKVSDIQALYHELAEAQISFNSVHFNHSTLSETPLPFIYSFAKRNTINVFFYSLGQHITLYIIDEKGSLFSQVYTNSSPQQLLTTYSTFLETLYDNGILVSTLIIEYYEILYAVEHNKYSVNKVTPPPAFIWDCFNIRITGDVYGNPQKILYSLYCNEREFSAVESNEDIFRSVADYIYDIRQSKEKYPIHITEIDVPLQVLGVNNYQQLQSIHFLQYKQKIEALLNTS